MTPASIRARIAASDGSDQGRILEKAWDCFAPTFPLVKPYDLADLAHRFMGMVEIGAHESAALLIAEAVLPGCGLSIHDNRSMPNGAFDAIVHPHASFQGYGANYDPIGRGCHGSCRTLAIIDAVCAAVEKGEA